jgi:hypothetical protein
MYRLLYRYTAIQRDTSDLMYRHPSGHMVGTWATVRGELAAITAYRVGGGLVFFYCCLNP